MMEDSNLENLYQEVILLHSKNPKGFVDKAAYTQKNGDKNYTESLQFNPTCGDEIGMQISLDERDGEKYISDILWTGQGCSISQASVSMMTELVLGKSIAEVKQLYNSFISMMNDRNFQMTSEQEDLLEDASSLVGVAKFPMRIKCALLGWQALKDCLLKAGISLEP